MRQVSMKTDLCQRIDTARAPRDSERNKIGGQFPQFLAESRIAARPNYVRPVRRHERFWSAGARGAERERWLTRGGGE